MAIENHRRSGVAWLVMLTIASVIASVGTAQQGDGAASMDDIQGGAVVFADKEHHDIYLNKHVEDLMTVIRDSDRLVLVYIFHSEIIHDDTGQDWRILDTMFGKVLDELKGGYVTTYAIDCSVEHPVIDPDVKLDYLCKERDMFQPVFTLYKPPEIKLNPYTGKEMQTETIPYSSNQVTDPDVKKWITDNVPDYTQRLMTREDADDFAAESGIQKVYLFSAKQKVPPIYKALSATFRNRLRFAFVNMEASVAGELADEFGTTKWPTLLVQNQFATADDDSENHHIFDGKMKLHEMIDFVTPFALSADNKMEDRVIKSKSQTTVNQKEDASGYLHLTNVADIDAKILSEQNAAVLYIAQKDQLTHLSLVEELASEYKEFMNIGLMVVDDLAESSQELKREFKSTKLPMFRFYPNVKTGAEKKSDSFEIMLPKTEDPEEIKEAVMEEISSNFVTDVKDVTEKVYYSVGAQNSRDGKITVLYMYEGGSQVDFAYKALSMDPYLQEDFVFMALDEPSDSIKANAILPAVSGMLFIDEENPTPRIFNFQGMTKIHYREVVTTLLKMFPEKFEAYEEAMQVKAFAKQNPGKDTQEARNVVPREFKELRSQKDYDDICKSHKSCAIAILPAIMTIDYELKSFNDKIEILQQIDEQAGRNSSPIHYTWINATCHGEIFSYFDVDPTAIPTVVYSHVNHNRYSTMIGKFDQESIQEHEEKFKNGKTPLQELKVDKNEFKISELDCQAQVLQEVDMDDDFDEILAEILAEEKARREADGENVTGERKKKKKGDKKKGKKKKKEAATDEL